MSMTYADLLYSSKAADKIANRVPLGSRVTIGGSKQKVDKQYRGLTGTVVEYGHPASVYDHLVYIDEWEENRWFKPSEFLTVEEPDVHPQP